MYLRVIRASSDSSPVSQLTSTVPIHPVWRYYNMKNKEEGVADLATSDHPREQILVDRENKQVCKGNPSIRTLILVTVFLAQIYWSARWIIFLFYIIITL